MNNQNEDLIYETLTLYQNTFHENPEICGIAPGRVNLIGEHTDYNDGFVLPAAINKSIVIAASLREDLKLATYSASDSMLVEAPLDNLQPSEEVLWINYITGVAYYLQRSGDTLQGANLFIKGDIPQGAGLSSSAALEMAAAFTFLSLNNLQHPELEIIQMCQQAENEFVGVPCGIMDQFISCLGKKNHALFLDCRKLDYEYVPIPGNTKLLVCDTGIKRELVTSEYNRRREECQIGVQQLSSALSGIRALRDVSLEQFSEHQNLLSLTIRKRCYHVIAENERVKKSVQALKRGDLAAFGSLMYQSHFSLKNDYEVSTAELDTVVDICAECEGVYGARMTGAGFGGSAICLVQENYMNEVIARLNDEYPKKTGGTLSIYGCSIEDGVKIAEIE
ncbi:MAG: galactokinase [bacterium]